MARVVGDDWRMRVGIFSLVSVGGPRPPKTAVTNWYVWVSKFMKFPQFFIL